MEERVRFLKPQSRLIKKKRKQITGIRNEIVITIDVQMLKVQENFVNNLCQQIQQLR